MISLTPAYWILGQVQGFQHRRGLFRCLARAARGIAGPGTEEPGIPPPVSLYGTNNDAIIQDVDRKYVFDQLLERVA